MLGSESVYVCAPTTSLWYFDQYCVDLSNLTLNHSDIRPFFVYMWILPKSNKSSDTYIASATTSKSNPINIVELRSNLNFNHSDDRPFLDCSSTFQYESCPSQIPQQIHALTPPRRAREILSTSLRCFQISLSTIRISDCSLPIQLHFNRSIYRNTHLHRFISVFKYGYKTEPAMKLLQ